MPAVFLQSRPDVGAAVVVGLAVVVTLPIVVVGLSVVVVGLAVVVVGLAVVVVGLTVVVGAQLQLQALVVAAGFAVVTAFMFKKGMFLLKLLNFAPRRACFSSLVRSVR